MCGIFGAVGRRSTDGLREAALTLQHRGPDGFGEWASPDRLAYLAHCRLSIIDLSDAGSQPMPNEDGSVMLTYNGEIYNFAEIRAQLEQLGHRFRSKTDSEILVHGYEQWGTDIVRRIRGMFAFALWDDRRKRLFLARDNLGIKPLYYYLRGEQLLFASEPRAIVPLIDRPEPDHASLRRFLQDGYISGARSIWKGVSRLPPATWLEFDARLAAVRIERYWTPQPSSVPSSLSEASDRLEQLIDDEVSAELVSDVPVGVFLSGGIDSSLVAASAVRARRDTDSFFVDFAGWGGSERDDSRAAAEHLGTTHHVEVIELDPLGREEGPGVFDAFDEPIGDPAIVPTWYLSQAIRRRVGVALSGDGGDELFGGYSRFEQVRATPRRRASWMIERARRHLGRGRPWPQGCAGQHEYYRLLQSPSFSSVELDQLFPGLEREPGSGDPISVGFDPVGVGEDSQKYWQVLDMHSYLVDNNLARMDRASMAHGLEVRVPLLDRRIAELALALPDALVDARHGGKPVLRALAGRRLPERIRVKPKQGFSFPIQRLISNADAVASLRNGALLRSGLLDRDGFERWLGQPRLSNHDLKIWLLYVLDQWAGRWWRK